jgi:tRNA pseudouridine55 synthase
MARKRRGTPIHGWLIIDKPAGRTSAQVVAAVRRITGAAKAGHGGTLDPLATGVLPIALGEATKTVSYVMDGAKAYRFTLRFGEARTTDDAEGPVTETSPVRPTDDEIRAVLPRFIGLIQQVPPAFSALKVDGVRAYDLARADEIVELAPRPVRIDSLELCGRPTQAADLDHAEFLVRSGKGAYMRSLARDIARALGTVGHVAQLRRVAVGPFTEAQAISLETLETLGHSLAASGQLLTVETALDDIPALALTEAEARRLRCGQAVGLISRMDLERVAHLESGAVVCAMADGKPVALARFEAGDLRPVRVLNL